MKRKEKPTTWEQDGAVNRHSLNVLKYSSVGSGGKMAPLFTADIRGALYLIFFTLFASTESVPFKVIQQEFYFTLHP